MGLFKKMVDFFIGSNDLVKVILILVLFLFILLITHGLNKMINIIFETKHAKEVAKIETLKEKEKQRIIHNKNVEELEELIKKIKSAKNVQEKKELMKEFLRLLEKSHRSHDLKEGKK